MDGLITGTIFVTVTLLFMKIGEVIDAWFTRRHERWLDWPGPIPMKVGMVPLPPFGVSGKEMQAALIELGRAMNLSPIDVTLKDGSKPPFLTDQEWDDIDRTLVDLYKNDPDLAHEIFGPGKPKVLSDRESEIHVDEVWYIETEKEFEEAWNQRFSEEMIGTANAGKLLIPGIKTHQ